MAALPVIFMGTAELSCASLQALLSSFEFKVVGVVTHPDGAKGGELKLQPSPVKELALRAGLSLLQPERVRDQQFIQQLRDLEPNLIAVAAYGQILPKNLLDLPPFG